MEGLTEHVSVASTLHTSKVLVILLAGIIGMLIGLLDAKSKVNLTMEGTTDCEQVIAYFPFAPTWPCEGYANW